LANIAAVSNVAFAISGADLVVTYNLKVDGVNRDDYTIVQRDYRHTAGLRYDLGAITAATSTGNGNYSITIPGGQGAAGLDSRYFFRVANAAGARAVVVEDYPAAPFTDQVTNQACNNCHGETGIFQIHGGGYAVPAGMEQCTVCHKSPNAGSFEDPWFGIIHGVHNSHNMPSGHYEYDATHIFSVTYPTYMNNCSVCHTEPSMLAAANAMTVTKDTCFSCHESLDGFGDALDGLAFHDIYADDAYASTICLTCHVANGAAAEYVTVTDFHNGLTTENGGVIWNGEDTSVTEGAKFTWTITDVVDNGTTLAISWTATYNNVGVDPCNATVGAGAPVFHGDGAGNLSVLYSYLQGGDPIRGTANAPGQADSANVTTTNTSCANGTAVTTITPNRVAGATVGRIAIQGKPRLVNVANASATMAVRAKTPVYDFVIGSGDPAAPRRVIVDTTGKCLDCHVGSLYQHGGNRVDNVDMCILCHNSASNDKHVRVGMGVDASEAYDGKVGQTFEMKTMLHAIHTAATSTRRRSPSTATAASTTGAWNSQPTGRTRLTMRACAGPPPGSGSMVRTGPSRMRASRTTSTSRRSRGSRTTAVRATTTPSSTCCPTRRSAWRRRWTRVQTRGPTRSTTCCRVRVRLLAPAATRTAPRRAMRTRMAGRHRPSRTAVRRSSTPLTETRLIPACGVDLPVHPLTGSQNSGADRKVRPFLFADPFPQAIRKAPRLRAAPAGGGPGEFLLDRHLGVLEDDRVLVAHAEVLVLRQLAADQDRCTDLW